jgi:hypothetical protein
VSRSRGTNPFPTARFRRPAGEASQLLIGFSGGIVGGLATVTGQFIISRANRNIARANRISALRTDRHKAITDFIQAVQRGRLLTSRFPMFGPILEHKEIADEARAVVADVWFRRSRP